MILKSIANSRGSRHQSTSHNFISAYLARRRLEVIDRLMTMVIEWFDTFGGTPPTSEMNSGSRPTKSNRSQPLSSTSRAQVAGQKRSARRRDDFDRGRDEIEKDREGSKRSRAESRATPKLACPFFKHSPTRYTGRQACTGPGWTSIARLKYVICYQASNIAANSSQGSIYTVLINSQTTSVIVAVTYSQATSD